MMAMAVNNVSMAIRRSPELANGKTRWYGKPFLRSKQFKEITVQKLFETVHFCNHSKHLYPFGLKPQNNIRKERK